MGSKEEELLKKYQLGECTPEERAIVENWYLHAAESAEDLLPEPDYKRLAQEIWSTLPPNQASRVVPFRLVAVAASVLLAIGIFFVVYKQPTKQTALVKKVDIPPASKQATLTLANGQKIILTNHLNGQLAQQGQTIIQVNHGKAITYTAGSDHSASAAISYNTLSTARGQQSPYPLILADGTKVWLDAASAITFPTAFNGEKRLVTVTGEAYFEVVHNPARPFRVKVQQQIVEDIGTIFNINAYDDEAAIKTTLIEGSVKVSNPTAAVILKPGQQAEQSAGHSKIKVNSVDVDDIMAWKNNYFLFDGDNLESILRKVSRWYDVDIVYQDAAAKSKYLGGTVSRFAHVSSVLKTLEMTGAAHFKLEGRKIIVTQ